MSHKYANTTSGKPNPQCHPSKIFLLQCSSYEQWTSSAHSRNLERILETTLSITHIYSHLSEFLVNVSFFSSYSVSSVQSFSRIQLFATSWIPARWASLSITNSWSSLRLTSIESVMPSSHLILCHPLLLLPPIPPNIRVFSNESALRMRWPKYWSFSFSVIPSKEIPGLISFRMDWLDLLAVQGTLNSLLQHHSSKASILRRSAFFTVQLSHPYMTKGKTIALTRRTFVGKVMSLLWICYLLTTVSLNFYWNVVDLQCCVSFRYTQSYSDILFQIFFHYILLQDIKYSSLCYAVDPCWLYIEMCIS